MVQGFSDLADLPENERIRVIGHTVLNAPGEGGAPFVAAIALEDKAKADRYAEKLKKMFPIIRIIGVVDGIVPGTVTLKVGAPVQ